MLLIEINKMYKALLLLAVTFAMAACNNTGSKKPSETTPEEKAVEITSVPNDLLNREWRLVELNGTGIVLDTTFPKYPYLKFDNFVSTKGNLGCNGFGANVHISATDSIKISEISATQMVCPNLDIEHRFIEALQKTKTYKLTGTSLFLNDDQNTVIARLQGK